VLRSVRIGRAGTIRLRGAYTPDPGTPFDPRTQEIDVRIGTVDTILRCAAVPAGAWSRTGKHRYALRDRSGAPGLSRGRIRQTRAGVVRFDLRATGVDVAGAKGDLITLTLHAGNRCWRGGTGAPLKR